MRFRLTVLLLILNVAVFFAIWLLELEPANQAPDQTQLSDFTRLEVMGKTIEKPRIIKIENNRWRIVSPIEWSANFFAISRIRGQLEFLDRQTSFDVSEISKHGQSLSDYGLDDPSFTFKYGSENKMHTLKVGKAAPVGSKIYMLDEEAQKIIVVDKELVESLVIDVERLRSQDVFEIPRFEINAISVRIPQTDTSADSGAKLRRIGLVKNGSDWRFETPIDAPADRVLVDAFINTLLTISAKSFVGTSNDVAGFDISAFPMTISITGTNRKQVLLLGNPVADKSQIYAKLEDNPTIFTLDAATFKDFKDLQTSLRDKSFLKFLIPDVTGIDISSEKGIVRLRNLKSGGWELSTKTPASDSEAVHSETADPVIITNLLNSLSKITARDFVSDLPGENLQPFGLDNPKFKISILLSDKTSRSLLIGTTYKVGVVEMSYAMLEGEHSIYGIPTIIAKSLQSDPLYYKSRIVDFIPEKGRLKNFSLTDIKTSEVLLNMNNDEANLDWAELLKTAPTARKQESCKVIFDYLKRFVVQKYIKNAFDVKGLDIDGKHLDWRWKLDYTVELPGTGKNIDTKKTLFFTERQSGLLQYGGSPEVECVFETSQNFIEAIFEYTVQVLEKSITAPEVKTPTQQQ